MKRKAEATANERIATTRTQKIVRDIARLQESIHLLIPKSSFTRTVKECLDNVIAERLKEARPDCPSKMTREAISMLQESSQGRCSSCCSCWCWASPGALLDALLAAWLSAGSWVAGCFDRWVAARAGIHSSTG